MIERWQAEALVTAKHADAFPDDHFMIAAVWEDAELFAITFGDREWLVNGDEAYLILGSWPIFIHKETGAEVNPPEVNTITEALDRLDQMNLLTDYTV